MTRFCPECGYVTEKRVVGGRERDVCQNCGFVQYAKARVGVGALVFRAGSVLLVERALHPRGMWTIPSGYQEEGETLEAAVIREVLEETGLVVQPRGIVFLRNMMEHGAIDMYSVFLCESANGEPFVNDAESTSVRFVSLTEFDSLNIEPDSRWFIEICLKNSPGLMVPLPNNLTHPYLQIFSTTV